MRNKIGIRSYVKDRHILYGVIGSMGGLLLLTKWLSNIDFILTMYITFIVFLPFGIYEVINYISWRKQCSMLIQRLGNYQSDINDLLDEPQELGSIVRLYEEMIALQAMELRELTSNNIQMIQDLQDYYAAWTHQIKTPISVIDLLLQSDNSVLGEKIRPEIVAIEQYVHMALCYARLESKDSDFVFVKVDMQQVIHTAMKQQMNIFIAKQISFMPQKAKCIIISDQKWLQFIIEQILSNALKYTLPGGQIRLELTATSLTITDSGIGIEASDLPRVMEKGFTGFNGRAYHASTGIGLYLCQHIANRLQIGLQITSTVGVGTSVTLLFDQSLVAQD